MQFKDWDEGNKLTEGFATIGANLTEKTSRYLLMESSVEVEFWCRGTRQHRSPLCLNLELHSCLQHFYFSTLKMHVKPYPFGLLPNSCLETLKFKFSFRLFFLLGALVIMIAPSFSEEILYLHLCVQSLHEP